MKKVRTQEIDMTQGNLFKSMFMFTIPVALTGILQLLYNAADMIVVGKFAGAAALSAVGSTGALVNLLITVFIGLAMGVGVSISQYYGARNYEAIDKTVHTAIALAVIGGVFLIIMSFFILEPLLIWMETPTEVLDGAVIYLGILFLGMPFNLIYNFGSAMLRAVGDTKSPLRILASSGLVNVILNLILVIFFKMGVAGVAIGTIAAQLISAVVIILQLMRGEGVLKYDIKKTRIHMIQLKKIARIGIPAGIQSALFSLSNVIVQSAINSFNSTIITAGNTAASNLEGIMYVTTNSVTQSAMTAAGQNMGGQKYSRVKQSAFISMIIVSIVSVVISTLLIVFAEQFISLYSDGDIEVVKIGVERLQFLSFFYLACSAMDVISGQLKGMGYYLVPTIVSFCGICVFRIAWIKTVFEQFNTLKTIYWSYPISWTITSLCLLALLIVGLKRMPKEKEVS